MSYTLKLSLWPAVTRHTAYNAALPCILLLSIVLNLCYITWGLPAHWHPDEIVEHSIGLFANKTLDPGFFLYPSLHIYLISLVVILPLILIQIATNILTGHPICYQLASGFRYETDAYLYARVLTAVLGTLVVFLVYVIAKRMFGKKVALLSAAFLTITAGFVNLCHFATIDIPACFWMTLSFLCCLRALEKNTSLSYSLAGITVGLAASTKYTGILMLAPLLTAWLVNTVESGSRHFFKYLTYKNLTVIFLAVTGGFIVGTPFSVIRPWYFLTEFIKLNLYQPTYVGIKQLAFVPHIHNLCNIQGIFLFAVSLAGLVYLTYLFVRYRNRPALLVAVTIWVIYLKMGSMRFAPDRYIISVAPFLAICAAKVVTDLLAKAALTTRVQTALCAVLVALGLAYSALYTVSGLLQMKNDDRVLALDWILRNIPETATIEVSGKFLENPMDATYGVNMPSKYANCTDMPSYHRKETFTRMLVHPIYRWLKEMSNREDWDEEGYQIGKEPNDVGLDALLTRRPEYLIVARSWYNRFFSRAAKAKVHFPLQHKLFRSLLREETPYKIVADFTKSYTFFTPRWEFVNSGIMILRYTRNEGDAIPVDK